MLFDCCELSDIQTQLWFEISNSCPSDILKDHIESMSLYNRSNLLLGSLANSYIREWDPLYCFFIKCNHVTVISCNMYISQT